MYRSQAFHNQEANPREGKSEFQRYNYQIFSFQQKYHTNSNRKLWTTCGANVNWYNHCGEHYESSFKNLK